MDFLFPYSPMEVVMLSLVQFSILNPDEIRQMSVLEVEDGCLMLNEMPVRGTLSDPWLDPIDRHNRCKTFSTSGTRDFKSYTNSTNVPNLQFLFYLNDCNGRAGTYSVSRSRMSMCMTMPMHLGLTQN